MEALGTLAGGIAHDFNNMLAIIIGNAELALDDLGGSSMATQNIKQIVDASGRATNLIRQILAFSRKTEQGKNPLSLTPLIKETCGLLRSSLPATIAIDVKFDTQAVSDVINGDPSQIQQVLMNLATNAAYAMRDKGGTLVISLSEISFVPGQKMPDVDMQPGRYLKLTVTDTGTGMTDEVKKRLFEPFFTTKEPGLGIGMGLAVVYGIVKSHGGTISVESEVDHGSTFTVLLPGITESVLEATEIGTAVRGGGESILLVDDEPAIVEATSRSLGRLGYHVMVEVDSAHALETFLENPGRFDLVITDQTMPGITGINLAEKMLEVRKDLPIILMTGYSEAASPEAAKSAGISELVMKPIVKREMAETIRKVLDTERRH
jgi:CheY-like chemotaxis protein